ncbi:MAG TPA: Nramp family divalent metal transporter [Luteolibacter sp.]|nr:Nramp family divalent metal transporter [Luteolibacter sp.]
MAHRSGNWLASLMPGIFLIGYNIGTGSLTAMSKAGANYGTGMLWAVLVSCLITWYLINFFSRFTMASGMTAMEACRKHIHPVYAWALWGGLTLIILSALMGMIGLLADVVVTGFRELAGVKVDRAASGVAIALVVLGLLWIGNTRRLEAMLGVMVALMGLAFIGTAVRFFPGVEETLHGFVPKLPGRAEGSDNSPWVILAGMVGTTVSVFAFLIRSGQVKEHGWTMEHWKIQKRDALVSASMMFVLSASVLLTATATLHKQGLKMNAIDEMIPMLRPVFGNAAMGVFVIGILAAGLSSHMPNMMVIPWLTRDLNGRSRMTRTPAFLWTLVLLTGVGILGAGFESRPVFLMLMSQAGISIVMPLALLGLMWLSARPETTGAPAPRKIEWLLLGLIAAFSLAMGFLALRGLITDLQQMIS